MSETTTHTPEAEIKTPHLTGVPEGMQLATLDDIVGYQKEIHAEFDKQAETDDYATFKAQRIEEILAENGIKPNEDDPTAMQDYELAKNLYTELIAMNNAQWLGLAEGKDRTEREDIASYLTELYKAKETTVSNPASREVDNPFYASNPQVAYGVEALKADGQEAARKKAESLSEADQRLDGLTKKYAEMVAERSKRMIETAKTRESIDASKQELSNLIAAIATEYMDDVQGTEYSGVKWEDMPAAVREEIVQTVDAFVAEQTDSIISQMEEHRMAEYNSSSPVKKWFYDKWASWGQEKGFITKGKLKKAAIFAVPGAALGAAMLPVAATAGLGVVTAGAIVMGTRSVARHLAGAKLDSVADSERVATQQSTNIKDWIVLTANRKKAIKEGSIDLLEVIHERTEVYRKRNLRRAAGGLAIALTVGALTKVGAEFVSDYWNGINDDKSGRRLEYPAGHDRDGDGIINRFDRDRDGDGVRNGQDYAPNNPNMSEAPGDGSKGLFEGYQSSRELTAEGRQALAEQLNGYHVKSGDTIWSLSEQFLHEQGNANPTTYEIDATKDVLLKELRASGNADSRGWLTAGDTIKIK